MIILENTKILNFLKMKKIPSDFTYTKYGVSVRLVREEDASFILSLRTNEKLSRFLHKTDNDLKKQIAWIRDYKEREKEGKDYYFIYFSKGKPFGVNRFYNISEHSSTSGSWICSKDSTVEESLATNFISSEISEMFGIPSGPYNVSKGNNQVLKFHLSMGAKILSENDEEYLLIGDKEKYNKAKQRYVRLLFEK